jgi:hypothetical protein
MLLVLLLSSLFQQSPDLIRIVEASRHELTGESGKEVNYEIRLVVRKGSAKLKVVSITVDQQNCTYQISNISHPRRGENYHRGDTLLIAALLKNPPDRPPQKEKPYPVIGCSYEKTFYYFPIRPGVLVNPRVINDGLIKQHIKIPFA